MTLLSGNKAPDFQVKDQDGNLVSLAQFKGQKLVIYFYPKDDTPGCTLQSCNLRDNYEELQRAGYQVLGVSVDDEKSHRKFIKKFNLNFPLLADTEKKMVNDYGVWREKSMYGKAYMGIVRTTFVIDENGVISEIIEKVDVENHAAQILK